MTRERTYPPCPWCHGDGIPRDLDGVPLPGPCACHGSGEQPATFHGPTFRDAQTATVIADLTEERDHKDKCLAYAVAERDALHALVCKRLGITDADHADTDEIDDAFDDLIEERDEAQRKAIDTLASERKASKLFENKMNGLLDEARARATAFFEDGAQARKEAADWKAIAMAARPWIAGCSFAPTRTLLRQKCRELLAMYPTKEATK